MTSELAKPARTRKGRKHAGYRIRAARDEVRIDLADDFFDSTILDGKGTTQLDVNILQVIQELRAALYFLGTDTTRH